MILNKEKMDFINFDNLELYSKEVFDSHFLNEGYLPWNSRIYLQINWDLPTFF